MVAQKRVACFFPLNFCFFLPVRLSPTDVRCCLAGGDSSCLLKYDEAVSMILLAAALVLSTRLVLKFFLGKTSEKMLWLLFTSVGPTTKRAYFPSFFNMGSADLIKVVK